MTPPTPVSQCTRCKRIFAPPRLLCPDCVFVSQDLLAPPPGVEIARTRVLRQPGEKLTNPVSVRLFRIDDRTIVVLTDND
jgi:uncharacterized OB-fold protein